MDVCLACSDNKKASLIGVGQIMLSPQDSLRTSAFTSSKIENHRKIVSQGVTSDFVLQRQNGSTLFGSILK